MLISINPFQVSDSNFGYECLTVNLPHYLCFIVLVNNCMFLNVSCILTQVTEQRCLLSEDRSVEEKIIYKKNASRAIVPSIFYPTYIWFCIKYGHRHCTISMLLNIISSISSQITFFLNSIVSGKIPCQGFNHTKWNEIIH